MIKITERRTSVPEQTVLPGEGKKAATRIGLIYCFLLHLRLKSQRNHVSSQPREKKKMILTIHNPFGMDMIQKVKRIIV